MLFFFQAEDGIRDLVRSRGLGDVYKRQISSRSDRVPDHAGQPESEPPPRFDKCRQPALEPTQGLMKHQITSKSLPVRYHCAGSRSAPRSSACASGRALTVNAPRAGRKPACTRPVSYTHLRAHETVLDLVCRLLLDKKHRLGPHPAHRHTNHITD